MIGGAGSLVLTGLLWPLFKNIPFMPAFLAIFLAGWFGGGGPSRSYSWPPKARERDSS
jgi:hypothetical protein